MPTRDELHAQAEHELATAQELAVKLAAQDAWINRQYRIKTLARVPHMGQVVELICHESRTQADRYFFRRVYMGGAVIETRWMCVAEALDELTMLISTEAMDSTSKAIDAILGGD